MITIQDVLDAGQGIFGLPVELPKGIVGYIRQGSRNSHGRLSWIVDAPLTTRIVGSLTLICPDGIRVIEGNGRLWRVLKASAKIGTNLRNNTHGFLTLKPLIPDKPKACDESIKAAYDQRRFGRFRISRNQLYDTPHRVLEFFLRSKMLILKAEYLPELDGPEYTVVHSDFAPVPQGEFAPIYKLAYSVESVGDGKTEEKIIGWNVTGERMK